MGPFFSLREGNTVNVAIFACIHFRKFEKIGNFAEIKILVSIIIMLHVSIHKLFSRCTLFSRIFGKRE